MVRKFVSMPGVCPFLKPAGGDAPPVRARTIAPVAPIATAQNRGFMSHGGRPKNGAFDAHRRGAGTPGPAGPAAEGAVRRRRLCLGAGAGRPCRGRPRRQPAARPAQGHRPGSATRCSRTRAASPTDCPPTTRCCGARAAWAKARWSRRCMPRSIARASRPRGWCWSKSTARISQRLPSAAAPAARRPAALPAILRRSFLRQGRHQLQIAEGRARRRHRRTAGECAVLRHLQPPPSDAARHDGE